MGRWWRPCLSCVSRPTGNPRGAVPWRSGRPRPSCRCMPAKPSSPGTKTCGRRRCATASSCRPIRSHRGSRPRGWGWTGERCPNKGGGGAADWRMAHEIGAANHGYVWPHVVFASDNEVMQVWATAPQSAQKQSVRYLAECAVGMPLGEFQAGVDEFISAVVRRLAAVGQGDSDLVQLWELVQADRQDAEATRYRQIEAALGYDPDECPQDLIEQALDFDRAMGGLTGSAGRGPGLPRVKNWGERRGLFGNPAVPDLELAPPRSAAEPPW